jgi:low temperature requirement protein LtrA
MLGLALSACLWWTYFGEGEDERALQAMVAAPRARRGWLALNGFYHWHLLILLGIIALASALEQAIGHPGDPLSFARSLALGGGVALFLAADVLFRRVLGLGRSIQRGLAAVLALATVVIGNGIAASAQIAALVAILAAALATEGATVRRGAAP